MDHVLQVDGLGKRYEDFALEGVSFTVARGTIMGLITGSDLATAQILVLDGGMLIKI